MKQKKVLFRTKHGSHLYGLNHTGSDEDWFSIVDYRNARARYAKQTVFAVDEYNTQDTLETNLGTFLMYCDKGVPQYLEAMFSSMADIDEIYDLRQAYRPNTAHAFATYVRTIRSFLEQNDFKHRRHAVRLALNLRDLLSEGRFNPTLNEDQIRMVNNVADTITVEELAKIYS